MLARLRLKLLGFKANFGLLFFFFFKIKLAPIKIDKLSFKLYFYEYL